MSLPQAVSEKLFEYCCVVGLDPESGLEPNELLGDSLQLAPLQRGYKSKVLSHFPEVSSSQPFDGDSTNMMCLPAGLRFCTQQEKRNTRTHGFVITRASGMRMYGVALTFFELVTDQQACLAMQALQDMYKADLANNQSAAAAARKSVLRQSPSYNHLYDRLYVTKCVCLLFAYPFYSAAESVLEELALSLERSSSPSPSLETHIHHWLFELPLPAPGRTMQFSAFSRPVFISRPGFEDLPLLDVDLRIVFSQLGLENVLTIFTAVLLEHQLLVIAQDLAQLTLLAESLSALLCPFTWQHVYAPILPASMRHFLEAPVPYIMGLYEDPRYRASSDLPCESSLCIVRCKTGTVEAPEDIQPLPFQEELTRELQRLITGEAESQEDSEEEEDGARDEDSGMSSTESSVRGSAPNIASEMVKNNETLARLADIVRRTGVATSFDNLAEQLKKGDAKGATAEQTRAARFTLRVRELFLAFFARLFRGYEQFVITPTDAADVDSWIANRESMQTFDKTAFLSDQSKNHLPFLYAFLETQAFTSFVDSKIMSHLGEENTQNLAAFDSRLLLYSSNQSPAHGHAFITPAINNHIVSKAELLASRYSNPDQLIPSPKPLYDSAFTWTPGHLPQLRTEYLIKEPMTARFVPTQRKKRRPVSMQPNAKDKMLRESRLRQPHLLTPANKGELNKKFVADLLKECKSKTKRMLVDKLGDEAADLGHMTSSAEENMLIASLADLLERIWAHGLENKGTSKSALWQHLLAYQKKHSPVSDREMAAGSSSTTGWYGSLRRRLTTAEPLEEYNSGFMTFSPRARRRPHATIRSLSTSAHNEICTVLSLKDVKTDVGKTRAFVRLALEKKCLAKHLKELLADETLLKQLYRDYAFLNSEEDREQFIYYLLTLDAVDFKCFTLTFRETILRYRVWLFCSLQQSDLNMVIVGTNEKTQQIQLQSLEFLVEAKNLGVLVSVRIGYGALSAAPRWYLDYVVIRNEMTGQLYKFPCTSWFGADVEDGSTEKMLFAETIAPADFYTIATSHQLSSSVNNTPVMQRRQSAQTHSARSPSRGRGSRHVALQEWMSDAANQLTKHFHRAEHERQSLVLLLCGERGLCPCLVALLQHGFKSNRMFRQKLFVWDFFEKAAAAVQLASQCGQRMANPEAARGFCQTIAVINYSQRTLGKDARASLLCLFGLRDRQIAAWWRLWASLPLTLSLYEEISFVRDAELFHFVCRLLESLAAYEITLDSSITSGIS